MSEGRIRFTEDAIPLEDIGETAAELVDLYGGSIDASSESEIRFTLPVRRGIGASGSIACEFSWSEEGIVTMVADAESSAAKAPRLILLVIGTAGAIPWLLWPFFPDMGPAAVIGGLIAFAVYFMTLRRTGGGVAYDMLQRLARAQREK
ncbi:MAG TPA: hypothetical protein VIL97_07085 [Thermoanaerobaculia bacterium]